MEYHFHKHKGRRPGGRDHLIEVLQCCSDDQEQQTGQDGVIRQEGAVAACKAKPQCLPVSPPPPSRGPPLHNSSKYRLF